MRKVTLRCSGKMMFRLYVPTYIGIDELTILLATQIYFFDCIDLDKIENLHDADEMASWLQKISRKDLETELKYILRFKGDNFFIKPFHNRIPNIPICDREKFIERCRVRALELFPELKET